METTTEAPEETAKTEALALAATTSVKAIEPFLAAHEALAVSALEAGDKEALVETFCSIVAEWFKYPRLLKAYKYIGYAQRYKWEIANITNEAEYTEKRTVFQRA